MTIAEKYSVDFIENSNYHIFNTSNNQEKLFIPEQHRSVFLRKYEQFMSSFLDTFCWCLTTAGFEIIARVKPIKNIRDNLRSYLPSELTMTEKKFLKKEVTVSVLIEQAFKRLFQSYALSFNNYHRRKGNLFHRPFKRIILESEEDLYNTLVTIHLKPLKEGLCTDFKQYKWSSFPALISENNNFLLKKEILTRFGSVEKLIRCHQKSLLLML